MDDRPDVAAAMRMIIETDPALLCVGCLGSATDLVEGVLRMSPRPDVVVLDATMPGRDPLDALQQLATECPSARTIMYSAHEDPALMNRAKDAGAWGWASKDTDPKALLRAVHDVASGRTVWPRHSGGSGRR